MGVIRVGYVVVKGHSHTLSYVTHGVWVLTLGFVCVWFLCYCACVICVLGGVCGGAVCMCACLIGEMQSYQLPL